MEEGIQKNNKQKNSNLSILLIIINTILFVFFFNSTYNTENQRSENIVCLVGGLTILLGGYAFSYPGKDYRMGKWIFIIVLIIFLAMFGLLWYATELGRGFSH